MITTPFSVRHPKYTEKSTEWCKWRDTMTTGDEYIQRYMQKYSAREGDSEFAERKKFAPVPAHAKSCLIEIRNSIFKQLVNVDRRGGSETFRKCMGGENYGVDLHGNSMGQFVGIELLQELLSMGRVGVFTDMPEIDGASLAAQVGKRPYYYLYKTEDILSWTFRPGRPDEYSNLILRDYTEITDSTFNLPCDTTQRIRHIWLDHGVVKIEWWIEIPGTNVGDDPRYIRQNFQGEEISEPIVLDIDHIPFAVAEISDSLLADVANYQIALMNLNSSDISYLQKAGYPFYVEQRDERNASSYLKKVVPGDDGKGVTANAGNKDSEISVGASSGRYYAPDMDQPAFIHPSSEPITASMAKQDQLKEDIRTIMNLSLSNVKAKMASEGSKAMDNQGLESGLSAIGLVLERLERKCAFYWAMFENNSKNPPITITYPATYAAKSDEDKRKNVEAWADIRNRIPSVTTGKWANKNIVREILGDRLTPNELDQIFTEIDKSEITMCDPEIVLQLVESGILDKKRAARILGIPEEAVEQASKEHLERLLQIQQTQVKTDAGPSNPAARGLNDQAPDKSGGKNEKKKAFDQTSEGRPQKQGRGPGKNTNKSGE